MWSRDGYGLMSLSSYDEGRFLHRASRLCVKAWHLAAAPPHHIIDSRMQWWQSLSLYLTWTTSWKHEDKAKADIFLRTSLLFVWMLKEEQSSVRGPIWPKSPDTKDLLSQHQRARCGTDGKMALSPLGNVPGRERWFAKVVPGTVMSLTFVNSPNPLVSYRGIKSRE